jgi:hypothetical protein
MQQQTPRQLSLLEPAQEAVRLRQLDVASRAEIITLLKRLLNECVGPAALIGEAGDE